MLKHSLALLIALTASPVAAQSPSFRDLAAVRAKVPGPTLVERYGPDDLRSGELRMPEGRGPFPVAVLIHGGCWSSDFGNMANMRPLADALARRGVATWNIGYRRVGEAGAGWPGTFEDVAGGIEHLRALAGRFPLDLSRVAYVGHSSGAHLGLWAASRPRLSRTIGPAVTIHPLSAVVIDGPGTLAPLIGPDRQVCGRDVIVPLMGGTPDERPEAYKLASPGDNLPLGVRQIFVPAELAPFMTAFIDASRTAGDEVHVLTPEGSDHFNVLNPSATVGAAVVDLIMAQAFKPPSARK